MRYLWLLLAVLTSWQPRQPEVANGHVRFIRYLDVTSTMQEAGGRVTATISHDGNSLIYCGNGIRRLDLTTGKVDTLVDPDQLQEANLDGESQRLISTFDDNHFVYATGPVAGSGSTWDVYLLTLNPFRATLLTDRNHGFIDVSPLGTAVATTAFLPESGLEARRLLLYSIETDRLLFSQTLSAEPLDMFWLSDDDLVLRDDYGLTDPDHLPKRTDHVLHQNGVNGTWLLRDSEKINGGRRTPGYIDYEGQVRVYTSIRDNTFFRFNPTNLMPDVPDNMLPTLKVYRSGSRMVLLRQLIERRPSRGYGEREVQLVVLDLKTE